MSVNQSLARKASVCRVMVPQVRLLEAGGSTGGTLGKALSRFTFFRGTRGALGKAFSPFTFYSGTRIIGGGAKRPTPESHDSATFFLTSLPGGDTTEGLERRSNSSLLDTSYFGRVVVKPPQRLPHQKSKVANKWAC